MGGYVETLESKGVLAFVPHGNSMWPFLKNGKQTVIIEKKPAQRLKPLDVVFYKRNDGAFVLHRIVQVIDGGYLTRGDSLFTIETISEESVFGVMQGFYKGKDFVYATNEKYLKKVEKWYKDTWLINLRKRIFHFFNKL